MGEFFSFQRVIMITGGCGFIGSNLVQYVVHKYPNYLIINVDNLSYSSSPYHHENIKNMPNYKFCEIDISNSIAMEKFFSTQSIDYIIHLAAQTHVDNSYWWALHFSQTNIIGTQILLEMTRKYNVRRIVIASTDEVYGGDSELKLDEDAPFNPCNPYSASKAAAELVAWSYWHSFKTPLIITRANNVYGPGQYPEKVIPKFISLLKQGKKCCMHGSGTERRNFIYVDDVCNAYDVILHKGFLGEAYNIGTDYHLSIRELAYELIDHIRGITNTDDMDEYIEKIPNRPINDFQYPLNSTKLMELNWTPEIDWKDGLSKTLSWYSDESNLERWPNMQSALDESGPKSLNSYKPE